MRQIYIKSPNYTQTNKDLRFHPPASDGMVVCFGREREQHLCIRTIPQANIVSAAESPIPFNRRPLGLPGL